MREQCVSAVGSQVDPDSNLRLGNCDLTGEEEILHDNISDWVENVPVPYSGH
jgi:hypothetical protein